MVTRNDPALAEWICLSLVAEAPTHGWAIAGLLAPDAEIGRIWSLSRPLTYRALDQLHVDGAIVKAGEARGAGRTRQVLEVTERGRAAAAEWLEQPVALPRDVRTEFLVKLQLRRRSGLSLAQFARRQQETFAPMNAAVDPDDEDDFVLRWRREHLEAIDRFLAAIAKGDR